ncbi:hypothetical protein K1T71_011781, partial [Dendrolimus kikuchii]
SPELLNSRGEGKPLATLSARHCLKSATARHLRRLNFLLDFKTAVAMSVGN